MWNRSTPGAPATRSPAARSAPGAAAHAPPGTQAQRRGRGGTVPPPTTPAAHAPPGRRWRPATSPAPRRPAAAGAAPGRQRQQLEALQLGQHQARQLTHRPAAAGRKGRCCTVQRHRQPGPVAGCGASSLSLAPHQAQQLTHRLPRERGAAATVEPFHTRSACSSRTARPPLAVGAGVVPYNTTSTANPGRAVCRHNGEAGGETVPPLQLRHLACRQPSAAQRGQSGLPASSVQTPAPSGAATPSARNAAARGESFARLWQGVMRAPGTQARLACSWLAVRGRMQLAPHRGPQSDRGP